MSKAFQIGDILRCIDASNIQLFSFTKDPEQLYVVVDPDILGDDTHCQVYLHGKEKHDRYIFRNSRFEKVDSSSEIIKIDVRNEHLNNAWQSYLFSKGFSWYGAGSRSNVLRANLPVAHVRVDLVNKTLSVTPKPDTHTIDVTTDIKNLVDASCKWDIASKKLTVPLNTKYYATVAANNIVIGDTISSNILTLPHSVVSQLQAAFDKMNDSNCLFVTTTTGEHSKTLTSLLVKFGYKWPSKDWEPWQYPDTFKIDKAKQEMSLLYSASDDPNVIKQHYETQAASVIDYLFQPITSRFIDVKLNNHTARCCVNGTNKYIEVGCQTFKYDVINTLRDAIQKITNNK
jgi:hypothetical protein